MTPNELFDAGVRPARCNSRHSFKDLLQWNTKLAAELYLLAENL